jgi:hypothetical protein
MVGNLITNLVLQRLPGRPITCLLTPVRVVASSTRLFEFGLYQLVTQDWRRTVACGEELSEWLPRSGMADVCRLLVYGRFPACVCTCRHDMRRCALIVRLGYERMLYIVSGTLDVSVPPGWTWAPVRPPHLRARSQPF